MPPARKTPLAAVLQGLAAGAIGTAFFSVYQQRVMMGGEQPPPPQDWSEAPEPAQVGQRVAEGVFQQEVPLERAGLLTQVVHWAYGTSWGAFYALVEESVRQPLATAVALTGAVVVADHTMLPAMKLYDPPWKQSPKVLGADAGHHLVYGVAVAGAYRALDVLLERRR